MKKTTAKILMRVDKMDVTITIPVTGLSISETLKECDKAISKSGTQFLGKAKLIDIFLFEEETK